MTSRCEGILLTLLGIAKSKKKGYCFPKQVTVENLLKTYHGFEICNRTLNRDLRWLEDQGWIKRIRRVRKSPDGKWLHTSTLYKFTAKVFNWLVSIQNRVKRLFCHFRLPKWADNQLSHKRASTPSTALGVQKLLIQEKDGTVFEYFPSTGAKLPVGS